MPSATTQHRSEARAGVSADSRLFAAFSLLNAVGYDRADSPSYLGVRRRIRIAVVPTRARWREELRRLGLLEEVFAGRGAAVMDLASVVSGPDAFALPQPPPTLSTTRQQGSLERLARLPAVLSEFWIEQRLATLWADLEPSYGARCRDLDRYLPMLEDLAGRISPLPITLKVLPNLLDVDSRAYGVSTRDKMSIIVGGETGEADLGQLLAKELLHRWADVAAQAAIQEWTGLDPMPRLGAIYPAVAQDYPEVTLWLAETVARAAVCVLSETKGLSLVPRLDGQVARVRSAGFIGVADICELLASRPLWTWTAVFPEAAMRALERTQKIAQGSPSGPSVHSAVVAGTGGDSESQ